MVQAPQNPKTQAPQPQDSQTQSSQTPVLQTPSSQTPALQTQAPEPDIVYPDCDGQPMANNTEQFDWIVLIKENLEILTADQNIFIAGDLFWYPIEGNKNVKVAPDVLVALDRPKGMRYSYKQWEEDHQPPQVVFEILSPSNTRQEMDRKLLFFHSFGVEEYYIYDPSCNELRVWLRQDQGLDWVDHEGCWTSPRLQIRMDTTEGTLKIIRPDGQPFLTPPELAQLAEQERARAEQEKQRAEQEKQRAEQEKQRAEQEKQHAEQEKQRAEQEKQRAEQEKQRAETAERQLEETRQRLLTMGLTPEQVAAALGSAP